METKWNTMWLFAQTHLWGAMINFQAFVHLPHPDSRAWIWSYKNRHKHNLRPNFTALACKRLQNILDTHCAWLVSPAASPGCCPRHTHTHTLEWEAYVQAGSWPQYLTHLDFPCAVAIFVPFFVCIVSASDSTIFLQKYPGYNCCFVVLLRADG